MTEHRDTAPVRFRCAFSRWLPMLVKPGCCMITVDARCPHGCNLQSTQETRRSRRVRIDLASADPARMLYMEHGRFFAPDNVASIRQSLHTIIFFEQLPIRCSSSGSKSYGLRIVRLYFSATISFAVKTNRQDFRYIRSVMPKHIQLFLIILCQKFHRAVKSGLHRP